MKRVLASLGVILGLLVSGVVVTAQGSLTQFQPGTIIRAEEVNANFQALADTKQDRVASECEPGSAIRVIAQDGSVTCAAVGPGGGIQAVTAGEGLEGGGESSEVTLSVAPPYRLPQACARGQLPQWDLTNWVCAAAGSGNEHDHMGQTWVGSSPLIMESPAAFSTTTGGVMVLRNTGGSGAGLLVSESSGYGLWVRSSSDTGLVVDSAGGSGIFAFAEELGAELVGREAGLLASGYPAGSSDVVPDIVLGGNSCFPCGEEDDDGRIVSDPSRPGSDIFLISNDAAVVQLDANGNEEGHFQVQNQTGTTVFQVSEAGEVRVNGGIVHSSDRARKEGLEPVDGRWALEGLASLPIHRWTYIDDPAKTPHVGPVAQDFNGAFNLGSDERYISAIDADGVAFAAIQALYDLLQEKDAEIAELEARIAQLEAKW